MANRYRVSFCVFFTITIIFAFWNADNESSCDNDESLLKVYHSDPKKVSLDRMENMKKYDYDYSLTGVDRRSDLSIHEFYDVYDSKWPVVISDVVTKWPAWKKWTPDYLNSLHAEDRIYVKGVHNGVDSSMSLPMGLFHSKNNLSSPQTWTYCSDEVFLYKHPELRKDIGDYKYLKENYFDILPEELQPWASMLLWGTKYSRSVTHMDPYNWTGTNAVLFGSKKWKLYPPNQDAELGMFKHTYSGFPLASFKYNSHYDGFEDSGSGRKKLKVVEFTQKAGELLIIPSGWVHQAYNPEISIAISSQMFNRNCIRTVLEEILIASEFEYGKSVRREKLPVNIDTFDDLKKVLEVIKLLPNSVLAEGKRITDEAIKQIS